MLKHVDLLDYPISEYLINQSRNKQLALTTVPA